MKRMARLRNKEKKRQMSGRGLIIYLCMLFKNLNMQTENIGSYKEELTLLEKKDQQIRRLQAQLEEEKKRAESAIKMLENYKSIQNKYQEGGETLRAEIVRRMKAEQELKQAQKRNLALEQGIQRYINELKGLDAARRQEEHKDVQDTGKPDQLWE